MSGQVDGKEEELTQKHNQRLTQKEIRIRTTQGGHNHSMLLWTVPVCRGTCHQSILFTTLLPTFPYPFAGATGNTIGPKAESRVKSLVRKRSLHRSTTNDRHKKMTQNRDGHQKRQTYLNSGHYASCELLKLQELALRSGHLVRPGGSLP